MRPRCRSTRAGSRCEHRPWISSSGLSMRVRGPPWRRAGRDGGGREELLCRVERPAPRLDKRFKIIPFRRGGERSEARVMTDHLFVYGTLLPGLAPPAAAPVMARL